MIFQIALGLKTIYPYSTSQIFFRIICMRPSSAKCQVAQQLQQDGIQLWRHGLLPNGTGVESWTANIQRKEIRVRHQKYCVFPYDLIGWLQVSRWITPCNNQSILVCLNGAGVPTRTHKVHQSSPLHPPPSTSFPRAFLTPVIRTSRSAAQNATPSVRLFHTS